MKCHEKTSSHHYSEISTSKCDPSKLPDVSQLSRQCNQIICKPDWKIESTWTAVSDYLTIYFYEDISKSKGVAPVACGLTLDGKAWVPCWPWSGHYVGIVGSLLQAFLQPLQPFRRSWLARNCFHHDLATGFSSAVEVWLAGEISD